MTGILTLLGLCVTAIVTSAMPALAQAPTITSPTANQVFRAGPDYASDVLHDPWDFNNVEDVGQYPYEYLGWAQSPNALVVGPSAFGVGSGKFAATNASNDPGIGLLYRGAIGIPDPGRNGQRYPIDTGLYRKLAFRLKTAGTGGSVAVVHWYLDGLGGPAGSGTAAAPVAVTNGERVYQIDLVTNHSSGPSYTSQAQMFGLRLDPINDASPAAIELDWVRLTAPDGPGAAMMPLATNCSGPRTVDVLDGVTSTRVLADSASGGSFNYGIFPPGTYTLRVGCNGGTADRTFVINGPPRIRVLQPDERGGADYATLVRGNPWDMDDAGDVATAGNLDQGGFVAAPQSGLMLRGRNVLSPNPSITGDPTVFWLYGEGASRPIASTRYRYLTFTTQLHHAFDLGLGSVARIVWASALNFGGAATTTRDILIWPGRNTYTIDLGALTAGSGLAPCGGTCKAWTEGSPRFFRFDPHEFSDRQVVFDVDNVTLTAPDEVVQGETFRVQWSVAGASAGSVNLYHDTDRNPANGRTLIATRAITDTFHDWNVGGLAPGEYYIQVEANETWSGGNDVRSAYSTGVLRVLSAANNPIVTIATQATGGVVYAPFSVGGCAYNAATAGAADEVIVYAHPQQGQMGNVVQVLGHNAPGGLGTLSRPSCGPGSGYAVSDIVALPPGRWTLRVLARNTVTGDFDEVRADNVLVEQRPAPARNLRYAATGNQVRFQWDPPTEGRPITGYRVEAAINPAFSPIAGMVVLPPQTRHLDVAVPNGTWYIRVITASDYSVNGVSSNVIDFTLPGGARVQPPGAVNLAGRLTMNPVTLSWTQAGGGAAAYTLHAGSRSGASDIAIVPMGTQTSLPPTVVPLGVSIFVRIVASNPAGSSTSNELVVNVPVPGPRGGPPIQLDPIVSGNHVTLRWNPPFGGAVPTSYAVVARLPGSPAVIASLTGLTGASLPIPGVPSGSYVITVAALYGATPSIESNPKTLVVP